MSTWSRVYPRVCGGTMGCCHPYAWMLGLSPRVRGNRQASTQTRLIPRSIPACAGEPSPDRIFTRDAAVYPRVCGGTGV